MSIRRKQHPSRLIIPLVAGLSLLISGQAQAAEPSQGAILYTEANFGGVSWAVGEGQYGINDLISSGIGNDNVSSAKVAPGYQLQLCIHGLSDCVSHTTSAANLGAGNNNTSSLIVSKSAFPTLTSAINALSEHVKGNTNLSEQALYDLRDSIINDAAYSSAATDLSLVTLGYQTVQSYESIHGPLFTDAGIKSLSLIHI